MANHPSAEKRNRQRIKRQTRNRHIKATVRSAVKDVRSAISGGDPAKAREALTGAVSLLDRAATKGVLHKSTIARTVSRLTVAVNRLG